MSLAEDRPIIAAASGRYDIHLPENARELLAALPQRMLDELDNVVNPEAIVPETLRRLFPPAYPTDASADDAYTRLMRRDLLDHHRESLLVLRNSATAQHLDLSELERWLGAISSLRLMFGSLLGITEDEHEVAPDDPLYSEWICYHFLSYLQESIVSVLAEELPDPIPDNQVELPGDPWGEPLGGLRWDGTPMPEVDHDG
jgi:hypothetical protein